MFDYFFLFNLKRAFYCWRVCLSPYFKKFKLLFVFFVTYSVIFCGGVFMYYIMAEVIFWNKTAFSSAYDYIEGGSNYNWFWWRKYGAEAEMPWSRKYDKNKFYYNFTDLRKRRFISRRTNENFIKFCSGRRSTRMFNRIDALSRTKFKHLPNKRFPVIGERIFFHWYGERIPKNLYHHFPPLHKKPSGRFGALRGFFIPSPRHIVRRPAMLNGYISHILPNNFYRDTFFWNRAIQRDNLLGYKVLPIGVLPVENGFFTARGSRLVEFLKGSRVKVFDFRFFELSLLNPGLFIDKRDGSGMVITFLHPAFYRFSKNAPVNDFFRDYIRQIKTSGLKDSVISLYLSMIFSDPDMFCYYLPRAVKFVFVDYSLAQAQFLRANSYYTFPVSRWNRLYTNSYSYRGEPSIQLRTAHSFIYRIAQKQ